MQVEDMDVFSDFPYLSGPLYKWKMVHVKTPEDPSCTKMQHHVS
jgi:hypothetical protein